MTAFKSFLFFVLAPGMVAGFIPLGLLRSGPQIQTGGFAFLAYPLWVIGTGVLLWCFWDFLVKGKGTPAPVDPPKELVVSGLYKFVRNPMYDGVLLVILGHFLWFGYWEILVYACVVFSAFTLFVMFYEEPKLKSKFGEAYENYLKDVPRWLPRFK
ncbi:MAG: isoprenylcysteine carboxylmethyltransferase family protein [Chloroflexi bacterium]|nr:isoprenylcysteine carboxylmethyltransferase family protein [Chloroflexota bacterium]